MLQQVRIISILSRKINMENLVKYVLHSQISFVLFGITFLYSTLIINCFQALLYCGLRPFNKALYRKISFYLFRSCLSQFVFLGTWRSPINLTLYVNEDDFKKYYGKENAYLISNHDYDIDWLVGFMFLEHLNVLGHMKAYLKKSVMYFPALGWNFFFGETIGVVRNSPTWKQDLINKMRDIFETNNPNVFVLFPEGTRFTKEKWIASRKFAEENGLPLLKHHLLPRTAGFSATLPYLQGNVQAIYNIQLLFKRGERPTIKDVLVGKSIDAHLYIERHPLDQVPTEEEASKKWLYNLFCIKDRLSESFLQTGDFFETSGVKRVNGIPIKRTYFTLLNEIGWTIVVLSSMLYGLFQLTISGCYTALTGIAVGFCLSYFVLLKAVDLSDSTKGSSYGQANSSVKNKTT